MSKVRLLLFCVLLTFSCHAIACTLLISSGKATPDGRPLLLKIRDSGDNNVEMRVVSGSGFTYTAQYSIKPTYLSGPWAGHNEKGFAIVNSLSRNIQDTQSGALNDDVIKMALESCETLDDFERLLDGLEKPTQVRANFGVIDAYGHAAFYEMGQNSYAKYDANDETVAPDGIMVRTNFSLSWDEPNKNGEDRYNAALQFVEEAKAGNQFNWRYVLQTLPRYLKNDKGESLYDKAPMRYDDELKSYIYGFIVGQGNSNALLYQGVLPGESPSLMVCWALVGLPLATVTVPIFNMMTLPLPNKICGGEEGRSWICDQSRKLCDIIFPYEGQDASFNVDLAKLYNQEQTGIMQRILAIEIEVLDRAESIVNQAWKNASFVEADLIDYYEWLDTYLDKQYAYFFPELCLTGIFKPRYNSIEIKSNYWDLMGRVVNSPFKKGVYIRSDGKKCLKWSNIE